MFDHVVFRVDGRPIATGHITCPADGERISIADRFTGRADHYRVAGPPHRAYYVASTVTAARAHQEGGLLDLESGKVYIDLVPDDGRRPPPE
jgi:hypothetical protein